MIAQDFSPERLERHFVREDGTYRIISELREICLFSNHNFLRDQPFSKLDLISRRNLLIYLNADLQDRLIALFHYALRDNGFPFLGTSENVSRHTRLFATVDKTRRIFRRLPHAERRPIAFPLIPADPANRQPGRTIPTTLAHESLMALAEGQVLDHYTRAFVVINAEGEVLQSSGPRGNIWNCRWARPTPMSLTSHDAG
jgi:two-component system CheB/CheR fusion protein